MRCNGISANATVAIEAGKVSVAKLLDFFRLLQWDYSFNVVNWSNPPSFKSTFNDRKLQSGQAL